MAHNKEQSIINEHGVIDPYRTPCPGEDAAEGFKDVHQPTQEAFLTPP